MSRRTELTCGLLSTGLGLACLTYTLVSPTGVSSTLAPNEIISGSHRVWQDELNTDTAIFLLWMLLALLGIGVGAYLDGKRAFEPGLTMLWTGATILAVGVVLQIPVFDPSPTTGAVTQGAELNIGLLLLPSMVLALIAATLGMMTRSGSDTPRSLHPR